VEVKVYLHSLLTSALDVVAKFMPWPFYILERSLIITCWVGVRGDVGFLEKRKIYAPVGDRTAVSITRTLVIILT
jgi:hypothetical protein